MIYADSYKSVGILCVSASLRSTFQINSHVANSGVSLKFLCINALFSHLLNKKNLQLGRNEQKV